MKYYQNKVTNEIIGTENMRDVISHPTNESIKSGRSQYSYEVVYDMICPNHILGNGITSFCITHSFLMANYKRIKKEIALTKYPDFKQYLHSDMVIEAKNKGVKGIEILRQQTF